jgi:hypothetical protein
MFLLKLHDFLNHVVSNGGMFEGFYQVITNLIYAPTLLNEHIRIRIRNYLIADCRLKMKALKDEYNPDMLQIIYLDLIVLNKLFKYGSNDMKVFQLFMELADINVAEVQLYIIRFCIERGWDGGFRAE